MADTSPTVQKWGQNIQIWALRRWGRLESTQHWSEAEPRYRVPAHPPTWAQLSIMMCQPLWKAQQTIFRKHLIGTYFDFFSLVHVPFANKGGGGLLAVLQPASRNRTRCFGFTLVQFDNSDTAITHLLSAVPSNFSKGLNWFLLVSSGLVGSTRQSGFLLRELVWLGSGFWFWSSLRWQVLVSLVLTGEVSGSILGSSGSRMSTLCRRRSLLWRCGLLLVGSCSFRWS